MDSSLPVDLDVAICSSLLLLSDSTRRGCSCSARWSTSVDASAKSLFAASSAVEVRVLLVISVVSVVVVLSEDSVERVQEPLEEKVE